MKSPGHTKENDLLVALGHPLRRCILKEMAAAESLSPRELSLALQQPLSNVSYHVRVLADHGAVTLVETKPVRGSVQHFYRCTVESPWARQALGLGEKDEGRPGESSGGSST